ncbi:MAG: hypothetical protein HY276_08930 [Ignavibacteriales bacterium]|nr:hypothetical protein [Ignavibacteriales bacterium]MBI3788366.1 hypothetical protein [Ignavibacteriales bacterium]
MTVLFVVATIIVFLSIEVIVRRVREKRGLLVVAPQPQVYAAPIRTPDGIFFARSHTWLNLFPSGKVRLGVDDFISRLLEKPEVTFLKKTGEWAQKGEPILLLKEGEHTLTVRSPFKGYVAGCNDQLKDHPEFLKKALFSDGWAYTLIPEKPSEMRQMLLGEETRKWISDEFARLRDVFAGVQADAVPALLQDGGPPVAGAMKQMPDNVWKQFEQEFLQVQ